MVYIFHKNNDIPDGPDTLNKNPVLSFIDESELNLMKTTCWVVMRGFGKLFGSSLQSKSIRDENSSGPSKNSSLSFSQFWEYSSSKASYVITMNYKRKLFQLIKLINYVV